jgi:hypothetical protein
MGSSAGRVAIAAASLASLAVTLIYGFSDDSLWSFAARCDNRDTVTFYYAARGALSGLDPYNNQALQQVYGVFAWWVYPPSALPLFLPLTLLPFAGAVIVFNVLKAIAAVALIAVWRSALPALGRDIAFWLFAGVALNTTVLQDWCSGNIAIFESLAIWGAVLLSLRSRPVAACAVIVLISLIKPLWLVLLLPWLATPHSTRAHRAALCSLAIGMVLIGLWLVLDYASFLAWLHNARSTLSIRYNLFELAKDLRLGLGGGLDVPWWQRPEYALYAVWCALVVVLSWRRWRDGQSNGLQLALLLIMAIAAVNPANLSYSWVMVLPILYLAARDRPWPWCAVIVTIALLPAPLLALALPFRDIGMVALLAVAIGFVALALETPHRNSSLQTID